MRQLSEKLQRHLDHLKGEHRYRTLTSPDPSAFADNDYLALRTHPVLLEAGTPNALAGSGGSRLLGGNWPTFGETEEALAQWFGAPAAVFFSSGYLANVAAVQVVAPFSSGYLSDASNHASLIDGMRLTTLPKELVPHGAWDKVETAQGNRALVAESLYSMDGDFVPADALRRVWDAEGGYLILDEAHAAGVFCEDGRGWSVDWRDWDRMLVVVTFGKAFGCAGAAILCSQRMREWIVNTARTFLFSTAPPPSQAAAVQAALQVLREESWRREELWRRAEAARERLSRAVGPMGQCLPTPRLSTPEERWNQRSPILPIPVPGDERALRFAERMRISGWPVRAIRHPTVPRGSERIRITLTLAASRERTEEMIEELARLWTEFS